MANIVKVQEYGNQLLLIFDTGSRVLAYPTGGGVWYPAKGGSFNPNLPDTYTVTGADGGRVTLKSYQIVWGLKIVQAASTVSGVDKHATVIALMVAMVESVFKMYANSNVPESLDYPHDATGSDHDSVGLFQQRANWGSVADRMDVDYSTRAFLGGPTGPNSGSPAGLLDISGWETMGYGEAAQAVQVSAFPDRYENWKNAMSAFYDMLTTSGQTGEFIFPFPESEITSTFRPPERPTHTGIDFGSGASNVQGTPIPAASDGKVLVADVYFGYGNAVIIDHGVMGYGPYSGQRIKTLYGHMVDPGPVVVVGQNVTQGQTLGGIGNTGNSRGNHLHWEVWANDVKIDPLIFMSTYDN